MNKWMILLVMSALTMGLEAQTLTTFSSGTAIKASDVNANFAAIKAELDALKARVSALEVARVPLGTVIASTVAPAGEYMTGNTAWALADGSNPNTTYYNGAFPDLRGRFLRGMNVSGGLDPDTRTVGSQQADAFQRHNHRYFYNLPGSNGPYDAFASTKSDNWASGTAFGMSDNAYSDQGGGPPRVASETRPANVAVYYYIRVQ